MTITRVTVGSIAYSGLQAIRATSSALAEAQAHATSGKQILKPSDNPTGTVQAMTLRSALARNDQYATNADDALTWLSTADSAYSRAVTVVQQARTLVVQGLNAGASDDSARSAIAAQIDQLRTALLAVANTTNNGRPVFGGTTADGVAYSADGNYVGDSGKVTRMIGADTTATVSNTGPEVFGSGASNVFDTLSSISAALRTNTLSGSALTGLDGSISTISSAQAVAGAAYQHVQQAQSAQQSDATSLKTRLSGIEEVDLADMAIKVTTANTAYQAALQTTAAIGQLSLLDFLR